MTIFITLLTLFFAIISLAPVLAGQIDEDSLLGAPHAPKEDLP